MTKTLIDLDDEALAEAAKLLGTSSRRTRSTPPYERSSTDSDGQRPWLVCVRWSRRVRSTSRPWGSRDNAAGETPQLIQLNTGDDAVRLCRICHDDVLGDAQVSVLTERDPALLWPLSRSCMSGYIASCLVNLNGQRGYC